MEDFNVLYCRLCLSTINNQNYVVIEDDIKKILGVLLLKLNFEDDGKYVMCNFCSPKLYSALKFKSTCLGTDDIILPYVDDSTSPVDIEEIYIKERESKYIPNYIKICRLCMQPIKSASEFKLIDNEQVDMIQKFVPEMNIFIIKEPVMCNLCFDSLAVHYNFLKKCSDMEQYIGSFPSWPISNAPSPVPSLHYEDTKIKFEDEDQSDQIECMDRIYKEIKIDSEVHRQGICSKLEECGLRSKNQCYKLNVDNQKPNTIRKYKIVKNNKYTTSHTQAKDVKCLQKHMLIHKRASEMEMYKCETCNFKTKYKGALKTHILMHKDPSELQMYKCEICNYESKYKGHLKTHSLLHKDFSEVRMYKCETCSYNTQDKSNFKRHMLRHKDCSDVQMYRCEHCNHVTKHKRSLRRHFLTHKHP